MVRLNLARGGGLELARLGIGMGSALPFPSNLLYGVTGRDPLEVCRGCASPRRRDLRGQGSFRCAAGLL